MRILASQRVRPRIDVEPLGQLRTKYLLFWAIHPSPMMEKCERAGDLIGFVPEGAH